MNKTIEDFRSIRCNALKHRVFKYFSMHSSKPIATCHICGGEFSFHIGRTRCSNLARHLKIKHRDTYLTYFREEEELRERNKLHFRVHGEGNFELIESGHGGLLLVFENQAYRKQSQFKDETSYWLCTMPDCKAKGNWYHKTGRFYLGRFPHNHPTRESYIDEKKAIAQLGEIAETTECPPEVLLSGFHPEMQNKLKKLVQKRRNKYSANVKKRKPRTGASKHSQKVGLDYQVILSTQKKRLFIVRDSFRYRQDKKCEGTACYWRCTVKGCKARAKTTEKGELELLNQFHPHSPERNLPTDDGIQSKLKEAAMDVTRPLIEIFTEFDVEDITTKNFLRAIRTMAMRSAGVQEVNVEPMISLPMDINEIAPHAPQLDPQAFISIDPTPVPQTELLPSTSGNELKEVYTIEEILRKMDENII